MAKWKLLVSGCLVLVLEALAQTMRLECVHGISPNTIVLQVTGPADEFIELESSANLEQWSPRALLCNTNTVRQRVESTGGTTGSQFYRARLLPVETPVILFQQPPITSESAFQSALVTREVPGGFVLRWPYSAPARVGWDVGVFTGFSIDEHVRPRQQRAADGSAAATAIQAYGDTIGLWFNTTSAYFPGELLPLTPAYDWPASERIAAFRAPGRELSCSFELKIPTALRQGQAEVYAYAYFLFQHATKDLQFWYGAALFDLRGRPGEGVHLDTWAGGTGHPIVNSTLTDGMGFCHRGPDSTGFETVPWPDFRFFDVRVSEAEFRAALRALGQGHGAFAATAPRDYLLTHVNLNPEAYVAKHSRVFVVAAHSLGTDQTLQVFFKTSSSDFYSEDKSVRATFPPNGGAEQELTADFSAHPLYDGTITGLRVDPISGNGDFSLRSVAVGDARRQFLRRWNFDGRVGSPGTAGGWTLHSIVNPRFDGLRLSGTGINEDPYLHTNATYAVTQSIGVPGYNEARLGVAVRNLKVALVPPGQAKPEPGNYRVLVKAANGTGVDHTLQVFFKTEDSDFFSEDKSQSMRLPAGGGYWELVADFGSHARYRGTITGLRVDPLSGDGYFGIDYVYVTDDRGQLVRQWDFRGQTVLTNPFFDWTLRNIDAGWTDGERWGGRGDSSRDPFFSIELEFDAGR